MRLPVSTLLMLSLALAACGKSPQNPPAPAVATAAAPAPAAASTPPASTAAPASTTPVAVAASTLAAAAQATTLAPDAATTAGPEVAGQVALAQGSVTDTASDGSSRQLKDDDSVYPGDSFVLGADSYLDLDLEDTGRILLRPNTTFQIQSYHYDADAHEPTDANGQPLIKPASAQPENAFFKLVKGGLRAVDGLIGQTHPDKYGVETPVATIGVRGTTFDVRYCGDDCTDEADAAGKPENGLYTSVSEGSIGVKNDSGETVTPAGHSGFVKSRKERMQALATPPKALRHMELPERLKPRADKNRGQIHQRRQQRRQAILEHRRKAAEKAKAGNPGKPAEHAKPETPAERRELRKERREAGSGKDGPAAEQVQRRQERGEKLRREEREGQPPAAKGQLQPATRTDVANPTPRELRKEKREERQQQKAAQAPAAVTGAADPTRRELRKEKREEHQQQKAAQAPAAAPGATPAKETKPASAADDAKCKDKKKRKDKKDKDKCGGD